MRYQAWISLWEAMDSGEGQLVLHDQADSLRVQGTVLTHALT